MAIQRMISTDAANKFGTILEYAVKGNATIIERYKRPAAVLVGYDEWERLNKVYSDLIAERQAQEDLPWEEVKAELIRDGIIDD